MKWIVLSLFCMALAIQRTHAASDGAFGFTSTGTSNIQITIAGIVSISSVSDFAFGSWSGSGNMTANDNLCIYANNSGGQYRITASGSGAASAFTVSSGGNTAAYEVWWNDQNGTTGNVQLTAATQLTGQTGANNTSTTCGGGTNANVEIRFISTTLDAAPAGSYTGSLSLRIDPG